MSQPDDKLETVFLGTIAGTDSTPTVSTELVLPDIPGYRILSTLGQGGMGQVFLAEHLDLKRKVALKVVAAGATASPAVFDRFRAESRAVAAVKHPGICQIFEAGQFGNVPFLAMEFIDGPTLGQKAHDQLPTPFEAAKYVQQIAEAIEASHQAGILHRDLKPDNVMIDKTGQIKIMDFGLAKRLGEDEHRTRTGEIIGTPSYMAPEQASGVVKRVGPACDVYATGAILYSLLTGRAPFATPDMMQTIMLVLTTDPVPPRTLQPRIPVDLETICLKCLEKQPRKRYGTAAELAEDLKRFLDNRPVHARQTPYWEKALKWIRRNPARAAIVAVASLAVVAGIAGASFHVTRLQSELDRSERLLGGMTDFGEWLVKHHIPKVAQLRSGGPHQAELVDKTLIYLQQLESDVAADRQLGEYVAQAYLQIAAVQSDPAFATHERRQQAIESCENAIALYRKLAGRYTDQQLLIEQAKIQTEMSRLYLLQEDTTQAAKQIHDAIMILDRIENRTLLQFQLANLAAMAQNHCVDRRHLNAETSYSILAEILQSSESLNADQPQDRCGRLIARLHVDLAHILEAAEEDFHAVEPLSISEHYAKAIAALMPLSEQDLIARQELAAAQVNLGKALVRENRLSEASAAFATAVEQQRRLAAAIPESSIVATSLLDYLELRFESSPTDIRTAESIAQESLAIAEQLLLTDPVVYRPQMQAAHVLAGKVDWRRQLYDDARQRLQQAMRLARLSLDGNENPNHQRQLAELLFLVAQVISNEIEQRSIATKRTELISIAVGHLSEALSLYEQLGEGIESAARSPYWQATELKHHFEDELDRENLRRRESSVPQSPTIHSPSRQTSTND